MVAEILGRGAVSTSVTIGVLLQDAALTPSANTDMAFSTDELRHPEYVNDDFRMFTFKVGMYGRTRLACS